VASRFSPEAMFTDHHAVRERGEPEPPGWPPLMTVMTSRLCARAVKHALLHQQRIVSHTILCVHAELQTLPPFKARTDQDLVSERPVDVGRVQMRHARLYARPVGASTRRRDPLEVLVAQCRIVAVTSARQVCMRDLLNINGLSPQVRRG